MFPGRASTRRFICIAALLTVCYARTKSFECQSGSLRLPKRVKPVHYDLKVTLDWLSSIQNIFRGRVSIDVEFDDEVAKKDAVCMLGNSPPPSCDARTIVLHAGEELQIETVEFVPTESSLSTKVDFCRDRSNDQLILKLDHAFRSTGQIVITYTGRIATDKTEGFFNSWELDSQGKRTKFYATLLEPSYARLLLPCFDEPEFKATFGVTVVHPEDCQALSNMHVVEESKANKLVSVRFENTPEMSTYLLAIAIGKFDHIETKPPNSDITFRAYTPPGRAEEARESLNYIVENYENFVKFFKVKQPLKKIDFVSVTTTAGAMENWGLVTIHPKVMLDGVERRWESVSLTTQHYAKVTISHELAHFWFGNMVTMKWWDDLWLKEGIAVLMSNAVANVVSPELGGRHYDLIYELSSTLNSMVEPKFDHPIKQLQLQSIKDIQATFDVVTYYKSSVVFRMLSNYLGGDKFQLGIQNYINKFMYKTAEAADLWESLNEVSGGLNVGALMNSWIYNKGFPLVEASLDQSDNSLRLNQRKFPLASKKPQGDKQDTLWVIPISFVVSNGQDKTTTLTTLLEQREAKVKLPSWFEAGQPGHYVKVNLNFTGLFRVMYDEDMLKALKGSVENEILMPADRMNLLDDHLALYGVGLITQDQFDDLTSWYKNEQHEVVLIPLMNILDQYSVNEAEHCKEILSILKNYFHNKLESTLSAHRDYELRSQENLLQTMVRSRVIYTLSRFNYKPALDYSLQYFRSKRGKVVPHMMKAIYSGVALAGTNEEFKRVLKLIDEIPERPQKFIISLLRSAISLNYKRFQDFKRHFRLW